MHEKQFDFSFESVESIDEMKRELSLCRVVEIHIKLRLCACIRNDCPRSHGIQGSEIGAPAKPNQLA